MYLLRYNKVMDEKRIAIVLNTEQEKFWRKVARDRGLVSGRGPYANAGSIQRLLVAIADGDWKMVVFKDGE